MTLKIDLKVKMVTVVGTFELDLPAKGTFITFISPINLNKQSASSFSTFDPDLTFSRSHKKNLKYHF